MVGPAVQRKQRLYIDLRESAGNYVALKALGNFQRHPHLLGVHLNAEIQS